MASGNLKFVRAEVPLLAGQGFAAMDKARQSALHGAWALFAGLQRWNRRPNFRTTVQDLDDATLKDIGLHRADFGDDSRARWRGF
jgi:uncharacterized protein YjiS (DUF1127 family)